MNITVTVPVGSAHHGSANLICTPPQWLDLAAFYFANYFAHAATVILPPGQRWKGALKTVLLALLLPGTGITIAIASIVNHATTYTDPIRKAAAAGALCMVGRTDTTGRSNEHRRKWWNVGEFWPRYYTEPSDDEAGEFKSSYHLAPIDHEDRYVNGIYKLTDGYRLFAVSPQAVWSESPDIAEASQFCLASSYNIPKLLISFLQVIWAVTTLCRAGVGDQIQQYGYAAFGLTVAQYAVMSILNILGNIARPEYPSMYIIRTPIMDEAEAAGCYFENEINVRLRCESNPSSWLHAGFTRKLWSAGVCVCFGASLLFIIIMWGNQQNAGSTAAERVFTVSWLVASFLVGPLVQIFWISICLIPRRRLILLSMVVCTPAIGGLVVVGQMVEQFGICTRF